jgi:hypothetical protein
MGSRWPGLKVEKPKCRDKREERRSVEVADVGCGVVIGREFTIEAQGFGKEKANRDVSVRAIGYEWHDSDGGFFP